MACKQQQTGEASPYTVSFYLNPIQHSYSGTKSGCSCSCCEALQEGGVQIPSVPKTAQACRLAHGWQTVACKTQQQVGYAERPVVKARRAAEEWGCWVGPQPPGLWLEYTLHQKLHVFLVARELHVGLKPDRHTCMQSAMTCTVLGASNYCKVVCE